MTSGLRDAFRKFLERSNQQTIYRVGDVDVENPLAAGGLSVKLVLYGEEGDPGFNSQPASYQIEASYKGYSRFCAIPAGHDGVTRFVVSGQEGPVIIREPGYQLIKVKLVQSASEDPLVDEQPGVMLRLFFAYKGPRDSRMSPFHMDFYLLPQQAPIR